MSTSRTGISSSSPPIWPNGTGDFKVAMEMQLERTCSGSVWGMATPPLMGSPVGNLLSRASSPSRKVLRT